MFDFYRTQNIRSCKLKMLRLIHYSLKEVGARFHKNNLVFIDKM